MGFYSNTVEAGPDCSRLSCSYLKSVECLKEKGCNLSLINVKNDGSWI